MRVPTNAIGFLHDSSFTARWSQADVVPGYIHSRWSAQRRYCWIHGIWELDHSLNAAVTSIAGKQGHESLSSVSAAAGLLRAMTSPWLDILKYVDADAAYQGKIGRQSM